MNALDWLAVALLGGCGAATRVLLERWVMRTGVGHPLTAGTFAVNISGAFTLGLVDGLALRGTASVLVGTALIGAYTTFSTWMLQVVQLRSQGALVRAYLSVAVSLLVGLGAVAAGHAIGAAL